MAAKKRKAKAAQTPNDRLIQPFIHQEQIVQAPLLNPTCDWFILAGGYGCGKSFSIVLCIIDIASRYQGHDISVGIGSVTITLAIKTIIKDLRVILKRSHSRFEFNKKENILTIGTVQFFLIATEQPGDIYAYNLHIFLCDEIDELSQSKVLDANKAIRERTRLMLPGGRIPYIMYFTTVQGYRGLYQVVQNLKEAGEKYVMVRGLTRNNTTLAKSYVKSLYAIYDDNERLAYLEGRFVNLRAGRVYPDFDEAEAVVPDIEIKPNDIIYVGQDLNAGFSKAVAVVKRNGVLYITHAWSFQEIGAAPQIMRQTYPPNEILWFPDASGKEILKGYKQEIMAQDIGLRIGYSNPSIVDRIFMVNKMFKAGKLKVCRSHTTMLTEALKIRQFNDLGVPEKGKGENAPDHICDSLEYVIYRIVMSDRDYLDLAQLSRENVKKNGYNQEKAG